MSALFFDIDGTILSEITHEIPESALVALRKHRRTDIRHYQYRAHHMQRTAYDKKNSVRWFFMWMWNTFGI